MSSVREYWNRRLDPLDWIRACERPEPEAWEQAREAWLDPATCAALEALGNLDGRRLLEIGCGQGYGTWHLVRRGARVVGLDLSDRRCRAAREALSAPAAPRVGWCVAGAERLPFAAASFDLVLCREVLMYTEPARVIGECARVLRPGGRAAFIESLAGGPLLRLYRRLTGSRDYRAFTRHLSWSRLRGLDTRLERVELRPFYLLSLVAFAALFVLRAPRAHALALSALARLDAVLLRVAPLLGHAAWKGVAVYRKPVHA